MGRHEKKNIKHGSTAILLIILAILLVPSWRIGFQGWFQSLWMDHLEFSVEQNTVLPTTVETWKLKHINGDEVAFSSFKNKPIILSFWATWCPPCRTELKELNKLQMDFHESISIVSVSEESVETIKKSGLSESYPFLYSTANFPQFFQIDTYPTLCIIDRMGKLIYQHSGAGMINTDKNRMFLERLIEK